MNTWRLGVIIALIIIGTVVIPLLVIPDDVNGESVCYSRLDDYFKERVKHINETEYHIIFPCPEFNRSQVPKDESGK